MLTDLDGMLVTNIELVDEKPQKTIYPRPGYEQAVIYTVDGNKIKTTIFSAKKKDIAWSLENKKARIAKQNIRVKLNAAGRIESETMMLF